jgi:DNA-binding transcriptional LysR family regulator
LLTKAQRHGQQPPADLPPGLPSAMGRTTGAAPDAAAFELFGRIVAAGSFAAAGRVLGITRAAVSRRVGQIEAAIGQPLFARTTRALGLTDAGRRLAARARDVLEATQAAQRALRALPGEGLAGTLRITTTPSFGHAVLAPLLARFQAAHPALWLDIHFTGRRVDLLREDVDVAFRITREPPEDVVAQPVLRFAIRAVAAPGAGWPLASPARLADQRCLLFGQGLGSTAAEPRTLLWQRDGDAAARADVEVQPACVADDLATLQAMARAGGGVTFLPDFCVRDDLQSGALIDALPGWRLLVAEGDAVLALTLPAPGGSEAARALVRLVREALAVQGDA